MSWYWTVIAGVASGALVCAASRAPLLAWLALAPLGVAVLVADPAPAALGGALAGAIAYTRTGLTPPLRPLLPLQVSLGAVAWAGGFGAATWLSSHLSAGWLCAVLPASAVVVALPARWAGAPRWVSNPLACTQEGWLGVVHTARLGGDLVTTATLSLTSAVCALLSALALGSVAQSAAIWAAIMGALLVAAAVLAFGRWSARAAVARVEACSSVRVAAVVVDAPNPGLGVASGLWPTPSPEYRDVDGTLQRYAPHVARAAKAGARIVVLPEVCVWVDSQGRARWVDGVTRWAIEHEITLVAPFLNLDTPRNELVVIDATGVVAGYEKQHPGPGLEPPRGRRMRPGPHGVRAVEPLPPLSTVICVDLDYADLVTPVRAVGGILAVPANDWFLGFEEHHHRTAVWSAVLTGVSVVRATGHGISSVIDGAGRVLARESSRTESVVLVADVPVALGLRKRLCSD